MNLKIRLVVIAILASITLPAWAIAVGPRVGQANDAQLARLAGLGKLWGYIKFTHPWMAFKTKEWDQALVAAIPKVKAAASAEEYGQAIDHMLSFLKDPATRRVIGDSRLGDAVSSAAPASDRKQPYIDWPDPETAVITATDYAAMDSSPTGRNDLMRLIAEASKAKSFILDIRRAKDPKNLGRPGTTVNSAITNMMSALIKESVSLPPARFVYHQGYASQRNSTPSYYSGLVTSPAKELRARTAPATQRPAHLIFLLNAGSTDLYSLLGGLQDQGIVSIVHEGGTHPDAGVMVSDTAPFIDLPDGIKLQVRRGEIVRANGVTGFRPDMEVPASTEGQSDPAKQAALDMSKKTPASQLKTDGKAQVPSPPISFEDDPYPQMAYPSEEYRLLALFRFWNAIQYFYPYKELMDQPWETALPDFIPRMQQARDATEYALAVAELGARLQDSHVWIESRAFDNYIGIYRPPIRVDAVEGQIVVTRIDESVKGSADLRLGDVVLAVDNEEITKRRERLGKYLPASNQGRLQYLISRQVLMGAQGSEAVLKVRTRQGETKEVKLTRSVLGPNPPAEPQKLPAYSVLPTGYGYIDFAELSADQANAAYDAVRNTPGLILDLRSYLKGGQFGFINSMAKNLPQIPMGTIHYDGTRFKKLVETVRFFRQPGANPYQGKVAVLINAFTQSASETVCLWLESIGVDVTFIGAPTSGANGVITHAVLPGSIAVIFTGMEVKHGDGRQLQRVGIQPNIEVRPTIEGVAQGRDEVMERAIKFLKGEPAKGR